MKYEFITLLKKPIKSPFGNARKSSVSTTSCSIMQKIYKLRKPAFLDSKIESTRKEIEDKNDEISSLNQQIEELNQSAKNIAAAITNEEKPLELFEHKRYLAAHDKAVKDGENLGKKKDKIQANIDKKEKKLEALKRTKEEKEKKAEEKKLKKLEQDKEEQATKSEEKTSIFSDFQRDNSLNPTPESLDTESSGGITGTQKEEVVDPIENLQTAFNLFIKQYQQQKEDTEAYTTELEDMLNFTKEEANKRIKEANKNIQLEKNSIRTKVKENDALKQEIEVLKEKNENLEQENQDLKQENEELKSKGSDKDSQLEEELQQEKDKNRKLKLENQQLEEKVSSLSAEVTDMKTELSAVQTQFNQYTELMQKMNEVVNFGETQAEGSPEKGSAYTKKGQ